MLLENPQQGLQVHRPLGVSNIYQLYAYNMNIISCICREITSVS